METLNLYENKKRIVLKAIYSFKTHKEAANALGWSPQQLCNFIKKHKLL